ncbi:MAG: NADP-specific glutamate dehydrogenase [Candidatus Yanofskybacteria bacterium CG10_big_fil_rev_8_21_14_0_10_36_16]|uniref:Glutamate dehydrogenase n=1 Tax=Candidatus Yanofskybacteria bacterium CG10_big_fil_rev_8_21_14_0_10_36_16 TaxID=1975096 RepID=A0A2J0Q6U0_9BACT|nr:MAG: NADP-specific glutamate dehydrogenase [Candidatus Yanofskybacteria bacterium CG10_big_fil_rev_8_21_14_0_10_36_16]
MLEIHSRHAYANEVDIFMRDLESHYPFQKEFLQAVFGVVKWIWPVVRNNADYQKRGILNDLVEFDAVDIFKVKWYDSLGKLVINKGYRVKHNRALGTYKGGLRFHPSVNLGILKFLAFEQTFKNSLTGQPMGGAKGGSDFDPKGKTDDEIIRFCQAFMAKLSTFIGPDLDVPAGDKGVDQWTINKLFSAYTDIVGGQYFPGVITGKSLELGGVELRPEATGYGLIMFTDAMLKTVSESFRGKEVAVSGSGNVSQFAVELANSYGAKVITMSDSKGFIYDKEGISKEKLEFVMRSKANDRNWRISNYVKRFDEAEYFEGEKPWKNIECDVALPCATENEIDEEDARALVKNGVLAVAEGSNMSSTEEAVDYFLNNDILFGPGKAANAGGVSVSHLEMEQNKMIGRWERQVVYEKLEKIMLNIHATCVKYGEERDGIINYVKGANIGGFVRVADAMVAKGL